MVPRRVGMSKHLESTLEDRKKQNLAPIWSGGLQSPRFKTMLSLTKNIMSRVISGQKQLAKGCDIHSYVCLTSINNFQRKCGQELKLI